MKTLQSFFIILSLLVLVAGCGEKADEAQPEPTAIPTTEEVAAPEPETEEVVSLPVDEKVPDPEEVTEKVATEETPLEQSKDEPTVVQVEAPKEEQAVETPREEPLRTQVQEARVLEEEAIARVEQAETAKEMVVAEEIQKRAEIAVEKAELAEPDAPAAVVETKKAIVIKEVPPPPPVEKKPVVEKKSVVESAPVKEAPVVEKVQEIQPEKAKTEKAPAKEAVTIIAAPVEELPEPIPEMGIVYFDFDKSNIKPEFENVIRSNFEWLVNNPEMRVQLEGHCDERGTNEYNLALGERRARAVMNYILRLGANPNQFSMVSFGEERPVALAHNEDAWQKNRRVEFTRL